MSTNQMKSIQPKKNEKNEETKKDILKNSIIAGVIGFLSWLLIFLIFDPLAGLYKLGKFDMDLSLLSESGLYIQSLFVGFLFFIFFYVTLSHIQKKSKTAKMIMWAGIVLYALFYLGYLFLLFFFRFTDL